MTYPSSISSEELLELPVANFDGPISVIDNTEDPSYAEAIEYLSAQQVIGFDTETRPTFTSGSPHHKVALLQLSGADKAFLFRLQHTGIPAPLQNILCSDKIAKVGAAVRDDIRGLQAYAHFQPRNFVDLQSLTAQWGITEKSVRKMSAIILGLRVSKAQQLSNWEAPRLSGAQIKYAAIVACICREMYVKLTSE